MDAATPAAVAMPEIPAELLAKLRAEVEKELFPKVEAHVRSQLMAGGQGNQLVQVIPGHPTGTSAYDAEHNPKTVKVSVSVAKRPIPNAERGECYPGIGCAHLFWPNGSTERMVTDRQYAELLANPALTVVNLTELEQRATQDAEARLRLATEGLKLAQTKAEDEAKAKEPKVETQVPPSAVAPKRK